MSVKRGYRHKWKYVGRWEERKIGRGKWAFRFIATKNKKARGYGGFGRNSRFSWIFKGVTQRARKVGRGRYQTVMTGYKYLKPGGAKVYKRKNYY